MQIVSLGSRLSSWTAHGRQREFMNGGPGARGRCANARWPLGDRWEIPVMERRSSASVEAAAKMSRAVAETAPKEAPFRLEQSRPMEESVSHSKLFTLTAIHQHPLPHH
jgi:hypothetical protein